MQHDCNGEAAGVWNSTESSMKKKVTGHAVKGRNALFETVENVVDSKRVEHGRYGTHFQVQECVFQSIVCIARRSVTVIIDIEFLCTEKETVHVPLFL